MRRFSQSATRRRHQADERTIAFIRVKAFNQGYAVAVHGSRGPKDLDLVAVAWTKHAQPVRRLIEALSSPEMPVSNRPGDAEGKPHGRLCYILVRMHDHRIIDLSVMPPRRTKS